MIVSIIGWRITLLIDFDYEKFSNERQKNVLKNLTETNSLRKTAAHFGVAKSSIQKMVKVVRRRAALHGGVPLTGASPVPEPFLLKGESLLHNKRTGEDLLVWRKTKLDDAQRWEMMKEAIAEACQDVVRARPAARPKASIQKLCNLYVITDFHLGQYSWAAETGQDWDLKVAEELLIKAFREMIERAPAAKTAVFCQLGDFLHTDNYAGVTPASGHPLDADGRYPKVAQIAVRVIRAIISMLLEKHEKIIFVNADANHDPIGGGVWLRELIKNVYEKEPRIEVIDTQTSYYAYQHGKVFLGFHHGHLTKVTELDRVFASRYAKMWGDTEYRFGHAGHYHHQREIDQHGMHIMQHPTLAAMDAYSARHGYSATRKTHVITYHSDFGEISRLSVDPKMFK